MDIRQEEDIPSRSAAGFLTGSMNTGMTIRVRTVVFSLFTVALVSGPCYGFGRAGGLSHALEGVAGMNLEPVQWNYRVPSSLLYEEGMAVSFGGAGAYLLNPEYGDGTGDAGYAMSLNFGVRGAWDFGTTGIWITGGGQSRTWNDPGGVYHLTPGVKLGSMTMTHAHRTDNWFFGGTIYRASFSLKDEFIFDRFPSSSSSQANAAFYSLLPEAIGNTINYDIVGTHLAGFLEIQRRTEIGHLGVVAGGWSGSSDVASRHINTISSTDYDNPLLQGPKNIFGYLDWRGWSFEGRWESSWATLPGIQLWGGKGFWKAGGEAGLSDRAYREQSNGWAEYLEPSGLGDIDGHTDMIQGGAEVHWASGSAVWSTALHIGRYTFTAEGWGCTPTLRMVPDSEMDKSIPVYQAAVFGFDGTMNVAELRVTGRGMIPGTHWQVQGSTGLIRSGGELVSDIVPHTMLYQADESHTTWKWQGLYLGYVEISPSRALTRQLKLVYTFRQYIPLRAEWQRNGSSSGPPGEITGVQFGGLHTLRLVLSL